MHYELYLDSLFLLNFGMNLLLLCLVDHSMGHTATWYRLLAGAVVGAVWYLFPFLWKGTAAGKLLLCFLPGTILMLYVTFHIRSLGTLWNYFRKLMLSTFLIGGILAALLRGFPMGRNYLPGIGMTLGVGAFSGWILVWGRKKWNMSESLTRRNRSVLPGNFIFDTTYAASEPQKRFPNVPATEISIVLKIYLEKGTHEFDIALNMSEKFERVGFTT